MKAMIEISITRTGKNYGTQDAYSIFETEAKTFPDMASAKAFLKDEYGTCKRQAMYQDDKNGNAKRTGYVYCFNNKDWSHDSKAWHQQDWVVFHKVTRTTLTV